jgi:hypothetical protein
MVAAPFIVSTAQTGIASIVQQNMTEEEFNRYIDSLRRNPLNQATVSACSDPTGGRMLAAFGYDCSWMDQYDHNVIDAEARAAAAAAAAAAGEDADAFAANFDAAWNAYMTLLNAPPPILRDLQGTPLEPEGPLTVQGYPQRIPKPPGMQQKALPENEPQRVYNQDDSSEEPQLAIGESESPGLPLMTIGTVAIGGVLIFLWVRRDG